MNMTLHVTDACNLACKYCYQTRTPEAMSEETARKAVDLSIAASVASLKCSNLCALSSGNPADIASGSTGICFFGGEPLLMRQLILRTLDYCSSIHKETGHRFNFKLVTNGTLLDEAFMRVVDENGIGLGFSHDGLMQDDERIYPDGSGTAGMLDAKMQMILAHQPEVMVPIGRWCMTATRRKLLPLKAAVNGLEGGRQRRRIGRRSGLSGGDGARWTRSRSAP